MDVSSLTSTYASTATQPTSSTGAVGGSRHGHGGGPEKTMAAVAKLLGTDTDTLKKELAGGKTLNDLASAAGVKSSDLLATIQATLPTTASNGSAVDTAAMAAKIAGGQMPTAQPPKPPVDAAAGMDALSSALGVSSDDLRTRLTDGTGIADLLQANPQVAAQLTTSEGRGAVIDGYA